MFCQFDLIIYKIELLQHQREIRSKGLVRIRGKTLASRCLMDACMEFRLIPMHFTLIKYVLLKGFGNIIWI